MVRGRRQAFWRPEGKGEQCSLVPATDHLKKGREKKCVSGLIAYQNRSTGGRAWD